MERKLSKAEQEKLMWLWNEDAGLQLVYGTFERFVEARTGYKSQESRNANRAR